MVDPTKAVNNDETAVAQFQVRRQRQILVPIWTSVVLVVLYGLLGDQWVATIRSGHMIVAGLPVLVPIGLLAFSLWNWRCPRCHRLIQRDLNPTECASCDAPLG
jgi:hypothetical protein